MGFVLLAIGLVLIVEGLVYALAPSLIETVLEAYRQLSLDQRRLIGVIAIATGIVLVWFGRSLGAV